MSRFQMESWSSKKREWEPMQDGAAGKVWRPRQTAIEAAAKCLAWTGFIGIPAMQVRDTTSGEIVWREPGGYLGAGPKIELPDEALARKTAEQMLTGTVEQAPPASQQEGLF